MNRSLVIRLAAGLIAGWAAASRAEAPSVEDEILDTLNNLDVGAPTPPPGGPAAQAQALARSHLPTAAELGPGWRYAWEFPIGMNYRTASEAEYWRNADLGSSGMTAEMAKTRTAFLAMQVAREGLRPRDGILTLMLAARRDTDSAAERMTAEMEMAASVLAAAPPPTHRRRSSPSVTSFAAPPADPGATAALSEPTPQQAQRKLMDALNEPYRNLTDAQLQEQTVRRLTFARQRTVLIYGRCNNWTGLETAKSIRDLNERGVEASLLTVKLTLGDPAAPDLVPDLKLESRAALEARLNQALRRVLDPMMLREQYELEDEEEADRSPPQDPDYRVRWETGRRERREAFERKKAALAKTRIGVEILNLGDHAHEVSIQNLPPETSGVAMAHRSATIRVGSAYLDITFEAVGRRSEADIATELRGLYPVFARKLAAALGRASP